jgi:hypothetical protein
MRALRNTARVGTNAMRTLRNTVRAGGCPMGHGVCPAGARSCRAATRGVSRCDTRCVMLRHGCVALRHGVCHAATRGVSRCDTGVSHCDTGCVTLRHGRVALRHGVCHAATRACRTATRGVSRCDTGVSHCDTPSSIEEALRAKLFCSRGLPRRYCPFECEAGVKIEFRGLPECFTKSRSATGWQGYDEGGRMKVVEEALSNRVDADFCEVPQGTGFP